MTKPHEGGAAQKVCAGCGKVFHPTQPHFDRCPDCFRQGPRPGGETLPTGYLETGYFGNKPGILRAELLTSQAQQIAQALAQADVSMGQLRRYFTMSRALRDRLENQDSYAEIANELRRMRANVAAVVGRVQDGRQRDRLSNTLKVFIDRNVDTAVSNEQSFLKGFLPHFECVLAYFYWFNSQKGGRRRGP
jgi:CRISPR type III-A-associated protein Csm2